MMAQPPGRACELRERRMKGRMDGMWIVKVRVSR